MHYVYICVYTYISVCMCVYVHMYTHICIHIHKNFSIHIHIQCVSLHIYMFAYMRLRVYTCSYMCVHTNLRWLISTSTDLHVRMYYSLTFPLQPRTQRYFLVLEIRQDAEPFIFLVEVYQDTLRNWIPIMPSPSKNFLAPGSTRCVVMSRVRAVQGGEDP